MHLNEVNQLCLSAFILLGGKYMRKKNDEAKLEIYEVEAMSDTVRKDFVYGFIAGAFIGTAAGFVINQVKRRKAIEKQQEQQVQQESDENKASVKDKVAAQTDALKANAQNQLQDIKDKAQQLKSDVRQKFNKDEQETDPKALRAEKQAIRNEAAAHDLSNVSPKAQEAQVDNNPLKSSQSVTTPAHEFTATGIAKAAHDKAKLIENDNTVAAKVAELFKASPIKSSAYATVPVLVSAAAATAAVKKADTKDAKKADKAVSKPKDAEKRTNQTHEKASFDKGVITHDKATANHSADESKAPKASGKVETKTVNNATTTKTETTKTTNTPKKKPSSTTKTAKAASAKDATKTTTKTTKQPAAKGSKTTTQKTTTKTTKSAGSKSNAKSSSQPKGETTKKKIEKKTFDNK